MNKKKLSTHHMGQLDKCYIILHCWKIFSNGHRGDHPFDHLNPPMFEPIFDLDNSPLFFVSTGTDIISFTHRQTPAIFKPYLQCCAYSRNGKGISVGVLQQSHSVL
jgi:hypothetical protein